MHKIEKVAGRLAALSSAMGLVSAAALTALVPAITSADALNPLTERTLLLSSSSPGWDYLDGSGNTTYAPAGSAANGQKTGETFSFKVSTDSVATSKPIKAFTFQYCTEPAGKCTAPGDDTGSPRNDDATHSDLNVVVGTPVEGTDFEVYVNGVASSNWSMSASNLEDGSGTLTGKNNFITLTNSGSGIAPTSGTPIKVVFFGTETTYITNPGADAFFVKINDYGTTAWQNFRDNYPVADVCDVDGTYSDGSGSTACNENVIDGGVTVANVMNNSISIQTKVLETMDFSVGTVDPNTVSEATLGHAHGSCDAILQKMPGSSNAANTLSLGDSDAEFSLSTAKPYDATSYWRLSSNSSNGATVYYAGTTLHNTEGDHIAGMTDDPNTDASAAPVRGTEQFGLGINSDADTMDAAWTAAVAAHASDDPNYWHNPTLSPLDPAPSYGGASGTLGLGDGTGTPPKFAFNANANTVPVPIANESTQVVNCATGKMRYVGDIAATTPAGIYTTKINYVAAPEY